MRRLCIAIALTGIAYLTLRALPGTAPLTGPPFAGSGASPLVFAHRGGMGLWPENTLYGFRAALALGADVLEMDVRRSADAHFVVFHDASLERTTDGAGELANHTLAELSRLDAGHRFSVDGGRSFPFRDRGLRIPALAEVFRALGGAPLSVELKEDEAAAGLSLCGLVQHHDAGERLLVASFHQAPIDAFRVHCPEIATAATPGEVWRFYLASAFGLTNLVRPRAAALFIFERLGPFRPVTQRLVSHAAAKNLPIYVWGAQGADAVLSLRSAGVAGIATDRPDRLLALLRRE